MDENVFGRGLRAAMAIRETPCPKCSCGMNFGRCRCCESSVILTRFDGVVEHKCDSHPSRAPMIRARPYGVPPFAWTMRERIRADIEQDPGRKALIVFRIGSVDAYLDTMEPFGDPIVSLIAGSDSVGQ